MERIQPYKRKKIEDLKERAFVIYREGFTTREVGEMIGKSHAWVATAVKDKLSTDKDLQDLTSPK